MLFVYARHTPDCSNKNDVKYRRCRCPKWIDGYVDGKRARKSAQTRSWERAERKARLIDEAEDPAAQRQPVPTSIAKAVEAFLADEKGRNLSKETTKQSKTLFEKQFLAWAKHRGLSRLRVNFRATWNNNGLTANRKLSRIVGFFSFCIQNGWLNENPAAKVKRATVHSLPTGWFPKPEFKRIVDATCVYGEWRGGRDFQFRSDRLRALVLLMRWSGLAIQDAVTLERERLSDDGKLFLIAPRLAFPFACRFPPMSLKFCEHCPASILAIFSGLAMVIRRQVARDGVVRWFGYSKSQRFGNQMELQNAVMLTCFVTPSRLSG